MKISIAMATYNGAEYLNAQLQSFVDQTRHPDELIITDDCSTDETRTVVAEFAKTAPFRVEFYKNQNNLGYTGNFNAALMKTAGDLVFLSDQDDVWFPSKIEHVVDVAMRNPNALVVMNDATLTDGELNDVGLTKIGQIRSAGFSTDAFVMGCCCAIRRRLLDFCLPIPAGFKGHDNWIVNFADGLGAKYVDESILQFYRRHEANESLFIANRITKVTRTQARLRSFINLIQQEAAARLETQRLQLRIFLDGVKRAREKAPGIYEKQLVELEQLYQQRADATEMRLMAVNQTFSRRIMAVAELLRRGGYRHTNVLRAVIRDILG